MRRANKQRRFFIPEVVQTSAMDCGPATLKSLFEGFGVSLGYGRIREACQTDIDGTSIDTLEDIAVGLGLRAEQMILPIDHLLLPQAQALPAIVVTTRPDGSNHFVVVWRRHGRFVQVMDPATGRRWPIAKRFLKEVYSHVHPVPAIAWRRWAGTQDFTIPLASRMRRIGVPQALANRLIETALADEGWMSIASLDAATRMIQSLIDSGGLRPGRRASKLLDAFFNRAAENRSEMFSIIPLTYWMVMPAGRTEDGREFLNVKGAVLVWVRGDSQPLRVESDQEPESPAFSAELAAALREEPARPFRELFRLLRRDGAGTMAAASLATIFVSAGIVFEALLLRGLFGIGHLFGLASHRLAAVAALIVFSSALLLLELALAERVQRLGRSLETRLRISILEKLPRLADRYFHSRLTSDMTERAHNLYAIRLVPIMASQLMRAILSLLLTTIAIIWLDPRSAPLAIAIALVSVALPMLSQPLLNERDLRVRTHAGALMRFYLDALHGLIPLRTHGGQRAIRREHEALLVEWARSGFGLQRRMVAVEAIQAIANLVLVSAIALNYFSRTDEAGTALLLIYWSLSLPALGQQVFMTLQQYPAYRNITLRLLEPLGAPEEGDYSEDQPGFFEAIAREENESSRGVAIRFEDVSVRATGHVILEEINLDVKAGSHIAIVGPSGAGKSSLVGLLLGWHKPASGRVLVDQKNFDNGMLDRLRRQTAWIDPAVQLWNRPLIDNLFYGVHGPAAHSLSHIIARSHLTGTLKGLPEGLQTELGEGGALLSGGEGQRVRLARGMLRPNVRLVILDEPFRGLDRGARHDLLANARTIWKDATLFCITHDVSETLDFERVIVMENGRIVEDGAPSALSKNPDSRFRKLLEAESAVRRIWRNPLWRRLRLEGGRLLNGSE